MTQLLPCEQPNQPPALNQEAPGAIAPVSLIAGPSGGRCGRFRYSEGQRPPRAPGACASEKRALFLCSAGRCVFNASADLNPKANLRRDWKREVFGWSPGQGNGFVVPADLQRLFQRPEVGVRGPFHTLISQPSLLCDQAAPPPPRAVVQAAKQASG